MTELLGYGEDALTFWALKHRVSHILQEFDDETRLSDCYIFYRPSFGRQSKKSSAVFGEFDAIIASPQNIYLIESKWDNLAEFTEEKLTLRREQTLRHEIFAWYLTHWSAKYANNWAQFEKEQRDNFHFKGKKIAHVNSLLATNLEFVLNRLLDHCKNFSSKDNIKNVLIFFYKGTPKPSFEVGRVFKLVLIDYGKETSGNFVPLNLQEREK